jgi:uncharacterized membrane protein YphA (DoxX/SURF4 family)
MIAALIEPVLSVGLGLVFLAAAIPKLRNPRRFTLAVIEYRVLPPDLSRRYAAVIPPLELAVGLALILAIGSRLVAVLAAFLLVNFSVAIGINIGRGRDIDCHCFGGAAQRKTGWSTLGQDVLLLIAAIALIVVSPGWTNLSAWSPFQRFGSGIGLSVCILGAAACTIVMARLNASATHRSRGERMSMVIGPGGWSRKLQRGRK